MKHLRAIGEGTDTNDFAPCLEVLTCPHVTTESTTFEIRATSNLVLFNKSTEVFHLLDRHHALHTYKSLCFLAQALFYI